MTESPYDDRDLRQLLASTDVEPADEEFVAAVAAKLAARRRLSRTGYAAGILGSAAAVLVVLPSILAVSTRVAEFPATHADMVAAALSSPIGAALAAVTAALALVRAFAPE